MHEIGGELTDFLIPVVMYMLVIVALSIYSILLMGVFFTYVHDRMLSFIVHLYCLCASFLQAIEHTLWIQLKQ